MKFHVHVSDDAVYTLRDKMTSSFQREDGSLWQIVVCLLARDAENTPVRNRVSSSENVINCSGNKSSKCGRAAASSVCLENTPGRSRLTPTSVNVHVESALFTLRFSPSLEEFIRASQVFI